MYCLIYFCAAFSRVLRNMHVLSCLLLCCIFEGTKNLHHDQKYISFYIAELAVGSEQKLYFVMIPRTQWPSMIPIKTIAIEQVRRDIPSIK